MKLKIIQEGDPILRLKTVDINKDYPNLKELIANMIETMRSARGIGLSASQVGIPINLFVVDINRYYTEGFPSVFINSKILTYSGPEEIMYEECLSIPDRREIVSRPNHIQIGYMNENFKWNTKDVQDYNSRVLQHEYDHTQGTLFIDKLEEKTFGV